MNTHINKKRISEEPKNRIDSAYFERNQKWILWLANSRIVRKWIFQIEQQGKDNYSDRKIKKITPNSVRFFGKEERERFYVGNIFAIQLGRVISWLPVVAWEKEGIEMILRPALQYACFAILSFFVHPILPLFGLTTTDFYTSSTYKDGYALQYVAAGTDWTTIRGAGGSGAYDNESEIAGRVASHADSNSWVQISRALLNIDTSSIPDTDTISSATFFGRGRSKADTFTAKPSLYLCSSNSANNNAIVAGDYDSLGTTSFCDTPIAYDDFDAANGWNQWALNASGLAAISKTAATKLGLRLSWDILNSVSWQASKYATMGIYSFNAGAEYIPYLEVVYSAVVAPTVTTQAVSSIAQTTATGNGTITSDGGDSGATRGMCWKTSSGPTVSDSHATNGTGEGAYTVSMTGLLPNTHYYVKAYSINSAGTSYGAEVEFTTLSSGDFFNFF